MSIDLPDLEVLERLAAGASGVPLQLPLAAIDEDPEQPRQEFDAQALEELAMTIAAGGVRQPISVRAHPTDPGRWMLNFGARRLRASRLAGKAAIPAFVDAVFDSYDQVIENEQREPLKPLELALFIERRVGAGESRTAIARRLGKSASYVTLVGALIDAPAFLLELHRSGRCHGITELYELRKLHETRPDAVERWAAAQESVSRDSVRHLKAMLAPRPSAPTAASADGVAALAVAADEHRSGRGDPSSQPRPSRATPARPARPSVVLQARYREEIVWIDLAVIPERDGQICVCIDQREVRSCVDARDLQLLRVVRT